jgi:hypothetical protein
MNESTEQLIRELAIQFGTTTEHLWSVLIRQAFISSVIDSISIITLVVISICGFVFVKHMTTVPRATENDKYPEAKWEGDNAIMVW